MLDKKSMVARKISRRGGDLACTIDNNDRVLIAGHAVDYCADEINF